MFELDNIYLSRDITGTVIHISRLVTFINLPIEKSNTLGFIPRRLPGEV